MHSGSLLRRAVVATLEGEDLGTLEEIIIHEDSGTIAYAVLSFVSSLRMGDSLFAVPWKAISFDAGTKKLVLHISLETLEGAPGFQKENWPDMGDQQWGEVIYSYYGYQPFWELVETGTNSNTPFPQKKRKSSMMGRGYAPKS